MFLSVGGCLGKFLLDFLATAPIIALHCLYRVGALQKMLNTDDAISVFRSLRSQEKYTFIKSTVFILGNFIGTFVGTTVVVTIKLTHYKRSVNFESRLAGHRFSQKTNRRICFVCFFTLHGKQIKFVRSFFGRIYSAPIWLSIFFWPLPYRVHLIFDHTSQEGIKLPKLKSSYWSYYLFLYTMPTEHMC